MANTAVFVQKYTPVAAIATAAVAGIGTSTVTGAVLLATGGTNGSLVKRISAMPRGTVTATGLALFLVKAAAPTVYLLVDAALMKAYAMDNVTETPKTTFDYIDADYAYPLASGDKLYAGIQVALAAGVVFQAHVGDL